jgi:hypothetical protein
MERKVLPPAYTRRMAYSTGLVECVLVVKCAFDKKLCSFETCG